MNICRTCLQEGSSLTNIRRLRGSQMFTKIMSLAKINIHSTDDLPRAICSKCVEKFEICKEFIEMCMDSNKKLKSKLNKGADLKKDPVDFILHGENCENQEKYVSTKIEYDSPVDEDFSYQQSNPIDDSLPVILKKGKNKQEVKKAQKQQCFTCGKVMSSRFRLKTHLRTHTGERPFKCSICEKKFSLMDTLRVHIRRHTGEKPLECTDCGIKFAQYAGLVAHKRKHTGLKPYNCTLCTQSFRTYAHLHYHIKKHTGEKSFECDSCSKAFMTLSDLKRHRGTHSSEKSYVCSICGQRLSRAYHLTRHILHVHSEKGTNSSGKQPTNITNKDNPEENKKGSDA